MTYSSLRKDVEVLLRSHGVLKEDDLVFPALDDALEWCEEKILDRLIRRPSTATGDATMKVQHSVSMRQRQSYHGAAMTPLSAEMSYADLDSVSTNATPMSMAPVRLIITNYLGLHGQLETNTPVYHALRSKVCTLLLTYSLTLLLTHSYSLTHSLTHSVTYLLASIGFTEIFRSPRGWKRQRYFRHGSNRFEGLLSRGRHR